MASTAKSPTSIPEDAIVVASLDTMMEEPTPEDIEDSDLELAASQTVFRSDADFDAEDVAWPLLRIGQQMTGEVGTGKAKSGEFILTGYLPRESVVFVPLARGKSRIYAVGEQGNRQTLCKSFDAIHGQGTPGGECAKCKVGQEWRPNPSNPAKNLPPLCDVHLDYIGFAPAYGIPVKISFKKMGLQTAKNLNSVIISRGMGAFAVMLTAAKKFNAAAPAGFYVPEYTILEDDTLDPKILETAQKFLKNIRHGSA